MVPIETTTHDVSKIEKLSPNGQRHDFSEEDWVELTGADDVDDLVSAVQAAYEAGVADGFGEGGAPDEVDDDLVLLRFLIEQPARRLHWRGMRRALLRRLLLRRLLARAGHASSAPQQRRQPIATEARNGSASHEHPYKGAH